MLWQSSLALKNAAGVDFLSEPEKFLIFTPGKQLRTDENKARKVFKRIHDDL